MRAHGPGKIAMLTVCMIIVPMLMISCKKSLGDRWVFPATGTDIFTAADEKSAVVAHIPGGTKVEAIQEKGEAEKWTEVKWNDKKGWARSGSLSQTENVEPPAVESSLPTETIIPLPELEAAAKEYYENRLKKALGEMQDQMIAELVGKLHKFGYSVKYKVGDFAVVKHGESFGGPPIDLNTYSHADALWQKKDGKWSEAIPCGGWGDQMYLYRMNNDEIPDVLVKKCVSDYCTLSVYLGKPDGTFQAVTAHGEAGSDSFPEFTGPVMKIGKCGGTSVEFTEGDKKFLISFDCEKNVLVKTKR